MKEILVQPRMSLKVRPQDGAVELHFWTRDGNWSMLELGPNCTASLARWAQEACEVGEQALLLALPIVAPSTKP